LWGRPLQLIDCQNLFCEIGKYARRAFPEISGVSQRKRIKQVYRPTGEPVTAWYPPKWGVNDRVAQWLGERPRDVDPAQPGQPQGVLPLVP
ncbi:MAG TPA: nucleotide kinase domain-containing protein, partial [Actinomycetota bacterium]|nr:nucleotide kinase domain-containing protein [Actinomycetota bacterium]